MTKSPPVFRFAPSPNGELHLGHAFSALKSFEMARHLGGRFLVRIEDIDVGRSRDHHVRSILDDLTWLGLTWEAPVLHQSRRYEAYGRAVVQLTGLGVLFPCFSTRSEIAVAADAKGLTARDPDGSLIYPGIWRDRDRGDVDAELQAGRPYALRLDMARACRLVGQALNGEPLKFDVFDQEGPAGQVLADAQTWGDAVIVRKDVPASYHLSVVVDDAHQEVTHVTRGADLLASTGLHRLLQVLLDLPAPAYHHHPLILDSDGRKLSKSAGSPSLKELRASGWTLADVKARLGLV